MTRTLSVLLILGTLSGCSALKEQTGQYVTEAVTDKIVAEVDTLLAKRNLSLADIRMVVDADNDQQMSQEELIKLVKEMTKDYVLIEGKTLVDQKVNELQHQLVSQDELNSKSKEFWNWLLVTAGTLVSAYLGKQVVSAKNDGKRDARLALLENILQKDLNGDGVVGRGLGNNQNQA